MSQIASGGGQPQKPPKYAPIYTGRFFNGLNTNRSPLRAASASHIAERFYSDNSGDALIAGANLEVTNRLTLARRPGNPIYDTTHTYNAPDAFEEFRVNKNNSDVFGSTLESIFTMVDEGGAGTKNLYSLNSSFQRGGDASYFNGLKFIKAAGAGQSYMQPVGQSLYFANGVQNKKWLTSLFTRTAAGNNTFLQGSTGLAGTYPFGTYLVDPLTGNIQEFIGISIGNPVTNVAVNANVATFTVGALTVPPQYPSTTTIPVGASFQLWGFTAGPNTWLNGITITLTQPYTYGSSTTLVAGLTHANYSSAEAGQAFVIQAGTTPYVATTGNSVPTYNTTQPSVANNFLGGLTLDGNTVWINRGVNYSDGQQPSVMNWGIQAPTAAPTFISSGSAVSWQKNTYYSPASIYVDTVSGNLWQITTPGITAGSLPSFPASPTARQKVIIQSVWSDNVNLYFTTATQSPALVAGDTVVLQNMSACGANIGGSPITPNLNGITLTVSATNLTTTTFQAPRAGFSFGSNAHPVIEYGNAVKTNAASTVTDGGAVWTCIQLAASLTWTAHTHYNVGDFIISASGFVFQLGPKTVPWLIAQPVMQYLTESTTPSSLQNEGSQGAFGYFNTSDPAIGSGRAWPNSGGNPTAAQVTIQSTWLQRTLGPGQGDVNTPFGMNSVNGAGEVGANSSIGPVASSWIGTIQARVFVPAPGNYTFTLQHNDGAFFSFDSQGINPDTVAAGAKATSRSSNQNFTNTITAAWGYGQAAFLCGTNTSDRTGPGPFSQSATKAADNAQWFFPQAGMYALEIDYAKWYHSGGYLIFMCPGSGGAPAQTLAVGPTDISGAVSPTFPAFTTANAGFNQTTQQIQWGAKVTEVSNAGQQYNWNNLGPKGDFIRANNTFYTLPGTAIIDNNGNQQAAYETGITGTSPPSFATTVGAITSDNPTLKWICEGSVPASTNAGGTITALSAQGWLYWIALVNTLDQTCSNLSPISASTGPINKGQVAFNPGAGLNPANIDPQADYVAIFRTTDGFSTPLLIPGFVNSPYTVPLTQYLRNGYIDQVPDTSLNNLVQGPLGNQQTPPAIGAKNLTYHLNRIWYSIGNTVYWTSGPLSPIIGNGTDGTSPGNFSTCSSQIQRLVPVAIGMLVFTVSDIYIIPGNGTPTSPILPAIPYLPGVGLANYNALDVNGSLIGFFTTDKQFVVFDPSAGLNYVGFNIGDQLRQNNGSTGQSWNTPTIYVAWYVNGEDQAWYLFDGTVGWYRLIATPAPEQGSVCWSPFATIAGGGVGAIKSVEVSPGVHNLLIAQSSATANILTRSLSATTDAGTTGLNGTAYTAWGVIGSIVLAQPGQIAKLAFIATDSVRVGSPLILGVLLDEALPYFTGTFDILKSWESDPTGLPKSRSILGQRFYLAENRLDAAYCRHMQILVQWPAEAAQNELQTLTVYGAYEVEQ